MVGSLDDDQLELVRTSVRHVIESSASADLAAALSDQGWRDMVEADAAAAFITLSEEAGRTRSAAPVIDLAMVWAAGCGADAAIDTAVVVNGCAFAGATRAKQFLVVDDDELRFVDAKAVTLTSAAGFDPGLGLSSASFDSAQATSFGDAALAARTVAAGRRALASQMIGGAEQMLSVTIEYVTQRHQYGRPIGSFQAVKHRLAEVQVAITAARAVVRTAWEVADPADGETVAIAAKCAAGRAQQLASTHCFQVHGGIAFTVEHGFQQWVKRGLMLDLLLGSHDALIVELGRQLISRRTVLRYPQLF